MINATLLKRNAGGPRVVPRRFTTSWPRKSSLKKPSRQAWPLATSRSAPSKEAQSKFYGGLAQHRVWQASAPRKS